MFKLFALFGLKVKRAREEEDAPAGWATQCTYVPRMPINNFVSAAPTNHATACSVNEKDYRLIRHFTDNWPASGQPVVAFVFVVVVVGISEQTSGIFSCEMFSKPFTMSFKVRCSQPTHGFDIVLVTRPSLSMSMDDFHVLSRFLGPFELLIFVSCRVTIYLFFLSCNAHLTSKMFLTFLQYVNFFPPNPYHVQRKPLTTSRLINDLFLSLNFFGLVCLITSCSALLDKEMRAPRLSSSAEKMEVSRLKRNQPVFHFILHNNDGRENRRCAERNLLQRSLRFVSLCQPPSREEAEERERTFFFAPIR